jgi:hypothetical protein
MPVKNFEQPIIRRKKNNTAIGNFHSARFQIGRRITSQEIGGNLPKDVKERALLKLEAMGFLSRASQQDPYQVIRVRV